MSDLTITHGGVSVSKKSGGEFLSGDKKLNQMKIDLIDVAVAPDVGNTGAMAAGDLLFLVTEIPNAVSVPGGSALLQTCMVYNPTGTDLPLDIFITSSSQTFAGGSGANDPAEIGDTIDGADLTVIASAANITTILNSLQCTFNTGTGIDIGSADTVNYVGSLGAPVKAEAGSTSLYLFAKGTATVTPGVAFQIKLGFVKD